MRPRFPWALGLLLIGIAMAAGPASAGDRTLAVDDILRLHAAGLSDDIIISEIVVTNTVFTLDVDEILRLQDAGVSEPLLQFMIDTARPETPSNEESALPDTSATEEAATGEEQHAYVVEEPGPQFYVGLNWGYPSWWYGYYWHDYWYYDCGYYPWYVSWSWPCGSWYPSWYYGDCWAPAGWGYHNNYCSTYYPGWDTWGGWNGYGPATYSQSLSQHKYKLPGGSSGKTLYANAGLRTRDVSRVRTETKTVVRSTADELALDRHGKLAGDVRRGLRQSSGKAPADAQRGSGLRRPAKSGGGEVFADRGDVRRPVRPVRKPAAVDRPVQKVTRHTAVAPKGTSGDKVDVKQAPDAPVKVQSKGKSGHAPQGSKSGVRSAPQGSKSGVRSYGSRSAPSAGKATRSAPSSRGSAPSGGKGR